MISKKEIKAEKYENGIANSGLIVINKPQKILVATGIYPPEIGGPATYSKLLKEELPKISKDKIRVIILNFGEVRRWPKIIRHIIYFFKAWYRGRYCDVIFAQDPVSVGLPTWLAAKILRKPFILKIVGDYAWEQGVARYGITDNLDIFSTKREYPWFVRALKSVEAFVAKEAKQIIVPSFYLKKIVENWGISSEKISVIYNAFEEPKNIDSKEALRKKLKVEGEIIMSVGRLVPWKGFDTLIELMPEILKKFPEAKLLIAGEGPEHDRLEKLIASLDLSDSVMLAGRMEQKTLFVYLKTADVFVLNTGYEGFSHQLLEVASLGTPIVTTAVGGNKELITDQENGLLVACNNKTELLKATEQVLADKELASRLGQKGKEKAGSFSQEKMLISFIRFVQACKY